MGLLKRKEEKEELERLGFEINEHTVKVMKAILGRTPSGFWKNRKTFETAVEIATTDLGANSSEVLRTAKNGKYRKIVKAFYNYREEWFEKKLSWQDGLEELKIRYQPVRTEWKEGQLLKEASKKEIEKAKKELENLGFEKTNRRVEVEIALEKEPPSFFWANLKNFKIGVEIATEDLERNTADALQKERNGRYNRIRRAFYKHCGTLFADKNISWEEALNKMNIPYAREKKSWNHENFLNFIKKKDIRGHKELSKYPSAFSYYRREYEPNEISVNTLVEKTGLMPRKWTKKMMRNEIKNHKITNWVQLRNRSPEVYEILKRKKKRFYKLLDRVGLNLEYSFTEFGEFLGIFNIGSEKDLKKKFTEEAKHYLENKEKFSKIEFRKKKTKKKKKHKTIEKQTEEKIVKSAEEISSPFCPKDGTLLGNNKTINGSTYQMCGKCKRWYRIIK